MDACGRLDFGVLPDAYRYHGARGVSDSWRGCGRMVPTARVVLGRVLAAVVLAAAISVPASALAVYSPVADMTPTMSVTAYAASATVQPRSRATLVTGLLGGYYLWADVGQAVRPGVCINSNNTNVSGTVSLGGHASSVSTASAVIVEMAFNQSIMGWSFKPALIQEQHTTTLSGVGGVARMSQIGNVSTPGGWAAGGINEWQVPLSAGDTAQSVAATDAVALASFQGSDVVLLVDAIVRENGSWVRHTKVLRVTSPGSHGWAKGECTATVAALDGRVLGAVSEAGGTIPSSSYAGTWDGQHVNLTGAQQAESATGYLVDSTRRGYFEGPAAEAVLHAVEDATLADLEGLRTSPVSTGMQEPDPALEASMAATNEGGALGGLLTKLNGFVDQLKDFLWPFTSFEGLVP